MLNKKVITVIIPVYNVEKYLAQCLDSVINQTYPYLQIIVINDGSPDNCHLIIEEFKNKDSRIVVINQANGGLSSARNAGLRNATGEYIMFVDSDDWIDENMCEIMIHQACIHDADVVVASYIREYKDKSLPRLDYNKSVFYSGSEFRVFYKRLLGLTEKQLKYPDRIDSLSIACSKLYNASILRNQLFENTSEIGTEDLLFNLMVLRNAKSGLIIPNMPYHYRRDNQGSLTSTYKPLLFEQWSRLFDRIYNIVNDDNELLIAYNNRVCLSIIGLGLNECVSKENYYEKLKRLSDILNSSRFKVAYNQLSLKYFPFHWKIFFFAAKNNISWLLLFLLMAIKKIISR